VTSPQPGRHDGAYAQFEAAREAAVGDDEAAAALLAEAFAARLERFAEEAQAMMQARREAWADATRDREPRGAWGAEPPEPG
jgi:hypothetical protein